MKKNFLKLSALITVISIVFSLLAACGEAVVEEHSHSYSQSYSYDANSHWAECECGDKVGTEEHSGGTASCTEKAKCDSCGAAYGELGDHNYKTLKNDQTSHWFECECGEKDRVEAHNFATLVKKTADAHTYKCSCGYVGDPQSHNFNIVEYSNDTTHWLSCHCGQEASGEAHVYVDSECVCGQKEPGWDHVHDYVTLRCDADSHWYECECKAISEKESHKGGEATCTDKAVCAVCFVSYGELSDHDYSIVRVSEDSHQYECACSAALNSESHVFTEGKCNCGYEAAITEHVHDFNVLRYNAKSHWYECVCKVAFTAEDHKGGEATCEARSVCDVCNQSYGEIGHKWNDGELTTPPTIETSGTITYSCTVCKDAYKNEVVAAGTKVTTRQDIEEALAAVAWAYYMKGVKLQYDSMALSEVSNHYGGTCRHTREVSPEFGTSDTTIYSVCTGYAHKVYLETINRLVWENSFSANGVLTAWYWLCSDNQPEESYNDDGNTDIDPITESDRDTAIVRWVDYEEYIAFEPDEQEHVERFKLFESSSFTDWYTKGKLEFYKAEGEDIYSYYLNGKKISSSEAKGLLISYLTETNADGEYVNLRMGDLVTSGTHTLVYIGAGYVLDCNGYKYDLDTGLDKVEQNGAVFGRMKTVKSILSSCKNDFVITRPLDYYQYDGDGNPGNDIIMYEGEYIEISAATESRLQYAAMEIDRTVNITPYGTTFNGDELTYTIKISNRSNESNFRTWMRNFKKGYDGENYNGVVISEIIPAGTEFVSASAGFTFENGKLTWNVDIAAGTSVELTYTVKVTADAGESIISDGGMVANIPSNSIVNLVGNPKLDSDQQGVLSEIAGMNPEEWNELFGSGLEFAEKIYAEMGVTLDLPTIEEIIENMFTPTYIEKLIAMHAIYKDIYDPIVMYNPTKDLDGVYAEIAKMLIYDYIGGYRLFAADLDKLENFDLQEFDFAKELNNTILELSLDYLEVGDIIVYVTAAERGRTEFTSEIASSRVLVYVGNGILIEMSSDGIGAVYSGDDAEALLDASFKNTNDLFFALRPSQAMELVAE